MSERKMVTENIRIEGAKIFYRNFSGRVSENNRNGDRSFALAIPDNMVEDLVKDGWNVKFRKPNEDGYQQPFLSVKVKFGAYPPIAVMINERGKLRLDEFTIAELDSCIIKNVDVIVRPYNYAPMAGKPNGGVAAYLKAIYVTVQVDDFYAKYADLEQLN